LDCGFVFTSDTRDRVAGADEVEHQARSDQLRRTPRERTSRVRVAESEAGSKRWA
jgi:hypothetical protein